MGMPKAVGDTRGQFLKVWSEVTSPCPVVADEVFFSRSHKGVIRGMHLQMGEAAGHRLVFATQGQARDLVIDLRRGSPTFGEVVETHLEPGGVSVLIPPGCAHGFESLEDDTTLVYVQEGGYQQSLDIGVHWTSCGRDSVSPKPVVSQRDDSLPHLSNFQSPFEWSPT